jgi:hypothetical protein
LRAKGLLAAFAVAAAAGCGTGAGNGGLKVKRLAAVAYEPANIAVYFSVDTKSGEPVSDLQPASFRIFEDGKLVPAAKGKRQLLDPKIVEARYTLILLDMSGPVVDEEYLPDMVSGAAKVAEAASRDGQVAISVFDGEAEVVEMLGFGAPGGREAMAAVRKFRPRSRSSNLYGAIQQSVETLQHQLANASAAHRYGTLVVFTDRTDLAHKVAAEAFRKSLEATPLSIYAVGVGAGVDGADLGRWAKAGVFVSKEGKDTAKGFAEIARKLGAASANHYVLSYCTPKRKGEHELQIVVDTGEEGGGDSGKLTYRYNAEGFTSGCSAKHKPDFGEK